MTDRLYSGAKSIVTKHPTLFMRTDLVKKLTPSLLVVGALVAMAASAVAQLSVGPTGLANQTFSTLPPATEWSTRTVTPSSAPAITTVAQLDASVQTNGNAALITSA